MLLLGYSFFGNSQGIRVVFCSISPHFLISYLLVFSFCPEPVYPFARAEHVQQRTDRAGEHKIRVLRFFKQCDQSILKYIAGIIRTAAPGDYPTQNILLVLLINFPDSPLVVRAQSFDVTVIVVHGLNGIPGQWNGEIFSKAQDKMNTFLNGRVRFFIRSDLRISNPGKQYFSSFQLFPMNISTQFPTALKNLFLTTILTLAGSAVTGQTFQTSAGYAFPVDERGVSGILDNNGNYLVLASNINHPSGLFNPAGDLELVRFDNLGNLVLPSRNIGQDVREAAVWIEKATDCNGNAGYIIAGNRFNGGLSDMMLLFTNTAGVPLWVRSIGTQNFDETAVCVKQDGAGNFVLVGNDTDPVSGISSIHVVKTDCNGALLWEQIYRINGSASATSVTAFATFPAACQGLPNEYFITGKTFGTGTQEEVFILSVNASSGAASWMNSYDIAPGADDNGTCIQGGCSGPAPGKGALWVSGFSLESSGSDPKKVLMLQTDIAGNLIWANNYDVQNSTLEFATHFQFAANQKLVLTGKAEDPGVSDPPENGHCLLMRISDDGTALDWTRVYTLGDASQGNRVEPTSADEYFISGFTFGIVQPHQFDYNILAIKTDQQGEVNSGCYHSPETQIIPRQPITLSLLPVPFTPQDYFPTALQTVLFDDKQVFCPSVQINPCDTLGLNANFSISGTGNTLNFTDLSSAGSGSIFAWNWNFGDAGTSTLQNPTHTYASPGVYTVCLIITGGTGGVLCSDTVCKDVLVPFEQVDTCEGNLVLNGNFSAGLVPGNLGYGGASANWATWTNTPQVIAFDNCQDPGAMQMWGNQVVGESVWQSLSFVAGGIYQVSFCGKWFSSLGNVQMRFRASNGFPGSYGTCGANCDEIFLSPVMSTSWTTYTSAPWTATQNYNTLTISVWNNFAINDGAYVSWSRIDDVCIRRIGTSATHESTGREDARLFPNPTSGDITVDFGGPLEEETMLWVMDLTGRKIQQVTAEQGQSAQALSLAQYPAGVYLVRAMRAGREVWTEKVVKE